MSSARSHLILQLHLRLDSPVSAPLLQHSSTPETAGWSSRGIRTSPPLRYGLHIKSARRRPTFRTCHGHSHLRQRLDRMMTSFLRLLHRCPSSLHKVLRLRHHPSCCCHHGILNACSCLSWLTICRTCASSQRSCLLLLLLQLPPAMCQHQSTRCRTLLPGPHQLILSIHLLTHRQIFLLSIRATAVSHTPHHVGRLCTADQSHGFQTSQGMTPASLPA